jgi:hypothetical protein
MAAHMRTRVQQLRVVPAVRVFAANAAQRYPGVDSAADTDLGHPHRLARLGNSPQSAPSGRSQAAEPNGTGWGPRVVRGAGLGCFEIEFFVQDLGNNEANRAAAQPYAGDHSCRLPGSAPPPNVAAWRLAFHLPRRQCRCCTRPACRPAKWTGLSRVARMIYPCSGTCAGCQPGLCQAWQECGTQVLFGGPRESMGGQPRGRKASVVQSGMLAPA